MDPVEDVGEGPGASWVAGRAHIQGTQGALREVHPADLRGQGEGVVKVSLALMLRLPVWRRVVSRGEWGTKALVLRWS